MEKKITLRFDMENNLHRRVYEKIQERDRNTHKSITDYVCATVIAYDTDMQEKTHISGEDRQRLCQDLRDILREMMPSETVMPGV